MAANTKLGNGTLSGNVANYATTKLTLGTDSVTGVYNGARRAARAPRLFTRRRLPMAHILIPR